MNIDDATDIDVFRAYVERVLGPTLRPGDIVVMDPARGNRGPLASLRRILQMDELPRRRQEKRQRT